MSGPNKAYDDLACSCCLPVGSGAWVLVFALWTANLALLAIIVWALWGQR